jgi:hypothetical protein
MSDPTRLFDGAGTDEERRLIGLARAEAPPPGSLARTMSVLGVAGSVLAPSAAHAALLASGTTVTGTSGALAGGSGTTVTLVALTKWLAVGALGGTLTVTAAHFVETKSSNRPAPPPPPSSALVNPAPELPQAFERAAPAARPSATGSNPPATDSIEVRDTLRDELLLLERARRSLAAGRSDEARDVLKHHRDEFPTGALVEEADVLRIEVLLARGEATLAEQAAHDFLGAHPASPHAPRVQRLLDRAARDPKPGPRPSMQ